MSRKKILPPEHLTNASEGYRNAVDSAVSAIPVVGGSAATLGRHVLPSARDKKTAEWRSDVSDDLNEQSDRLDAQARQQLELKEHTDGKLSEVSTRIDVIEQQGQHSIGRSDFRLC